MNAIDKGKKHLWDLSEGEPILSYGDSIEILEQAANATAVEVLNEVHGQITKEMGEGMLRNGDFDIGPVALGKIMSRSIKELQKNNG